MHKGRTKTKKEEKDREKLYWETKAVVKLRDCWEKYDGPYIKDESPDWYNPNTHKGIEVVRATMSYYENSCRINRKLHGVRASELSNQNIRTMKNERLSYVFTDRKGGFLTYCAEKGPDSIEWRIHMPESRKGEVIDFNDFVYITNWSGLVNTDCYEEQLYVVISKKLELL